MSYMHTYNRHTNTNRLVVGFSRFELIICVACSVGFLYRSAL